MRRQAPRHATRAGWFAAQEEMKKVRVAWFCRTVRKVAAIDRPAHTLCAGAWKLPPHRPFMSHVRSYPRPFLHCPKPFAAVASLNVTQTEIAMLVAERASSAAV